MGEGILRLVNHSTWRHRMALKLLKWAIVARSHGGMTASIAVFPLAIACYWLRRGAIDKSIARLVKWLLLMSERHSLVHTIINAIPDLAFMLLAVAGLSYLSPRLIKRIEAIRWARICLMAFFFASGIAAVVINAVNRASQEGKDSKNDTRMDTVLGDVTQIEKSLLQPTAKMTEAERRTHLLSALRDEYIMLHNSVDPEIVSGSRMPPDNWMNQRLAQLGERWTFVSPVPPKSVIIPSGPLTQESKASVIFGFYNPDMSQQPVETVHFATMNTETLTYSIAAFVKGDVPAKSLEVWIRRPTNCEWVEPPPPGFVSGDADHTFDRQIIIALLPANVVTPKWDFTIRVPRWPHYAGAVMEAFYACENCPTVNWKKPQLIVETNDIHNYLNLQFPPVPDIPEPVKQ